ncbi:NAD(P)/FAD-dependent oxidoreductase [Angustibacter sp. McL0619]|uniref:NAD(P)/FAD-dependent oxidoreductase n=1 Tax=Angustibacter sp. McL0619 TaxID=3415676 RepID=UPI003CEB3D64
MSEYEVVIIGGGAAGLSAALVLSRARRAVAVVDAGQPRNAPAAHMHGFLGWDGASPAALLKQGRDEVTSYGGQLISGIVTDLVADSIDGTTRFEVTLAGGKSLQAGRVLITTGLRDELPDITGVAERWGRDVLHCPYCHGYEVRDQPLGVLGGTPEAVAHALLVRQWSPDVVFFTNTSELTVQDHERLTARGIGIVESPVARLTVANDRLSGVQLESGKVVARSAVFVRPQFVANGDLLVRVGCATHDNGWVVADSVGATTVPGVWVAGNAVNPRAQVVTAAGEGSAAAIAINADLVEEDTATELTGFRQGLPL